MATRCLIGKQIGDKVDAIYCHFDGGLNGVGYMLKDFYSSESLVAELIALGDISSLGERIKPKDGEKHSFDHPASDVTVAYHRDRGEDLNILHFSSEEEYLDYVVSNSFQYAYLFKENEWFFYSSGRKSKEFEDY